MTQTVDFTKVKLEGKSLFWLFVGVVIIILLITTAMGFSGMLRSKIGGYVGQKTQEVTQAGTPQNADALISGAA